MKTLLTIPVKTALLPCIMEDKNETQYIYICNRRCIVQKTNSSPKSPSKFVATLVINNLNDAVSYCQKLNAKGIEHYTARY